jgi:nicotinate-nucleotide adenylyltransferase
MNLALFGGTFDPVHRGHLAVARAALAHPEFALDRIYFVPADRPPHKTVAQLTPYAHRCAMVQLAIADEPKMTVSEIEERAPEDSTPNYTIDTVRRFKQTLAFGDRLYYVLGMDSLAQLGNWREPVQLLRECPFIAVSRPGFDREAALATLPKGAPLHQIHFLDKVAEDVSATEIRAATAKGRGALEELVGDRVAAYIREHRLYR